MPRGSNGTLWEIDRSGRGKILSLAQRTQEQHTVKLGAVYSVIQAARTPTAANDFFVYLKNEDEKLTFVISYFAIQRASTSEGIAFRYVTGTPAGGGFSSIVNRKGTEQKLVNANIQEGNDITGLTTVSTPEFFIVDTTWRAYITQDRPLALAPGVAVGIEAITGTVALNIQMCFYFDLTDPEA